MKRRIYVYYVALYIAWELIRAPWHICLLCAKLVYSDMHSDEAILMWCAIKFSLSSELHTLFMMHIYPGPGIVGKTSKNHLSCVLDVVDLWVVMKFGLPLCKFVFWWSTTCFGVCMHACVNTWVNVGRGCISVSHKMQRSIGFGVTRTARLFCTSSPQFFESCVYV